MKKNTKTLLAGVAATLMATTSASAGGLEKDYFSTNFLFEEGNYLSVSMGHVEPSVTGGLFGIGISNVGPSYNILSGAIKLDITDALSLGLLAYEPTGYKLAYPVTALTPVPASATVNSQGYAAVLKYDINKNFAVYGGINYVTLDGVAANLGAPLPPGILFESDSDVGYIAGAAYSKPEIALRIALTYESGTEHALPTRLGGAGGPYGPSIGATTGGIPEAYMLEFQTGIAENTLLFGSIRKVNHSASDVVLPPLLLSTNLSNFSDSITYRLGLGYRINEKLAVSVSGRYEEGSGTPSSLDPTSGRRTLGVGFKYNVTENLDFSAGISHTWIGDNTTASVPAIPFTDNTAWAYGAKVGYHF